MRGAEVPRAGRAARARPNPVLFRHGSSRFPIGAPVLALVLLAAGCATVGPGPGEPAAAPEAGAEEAEAGREPLPEPVATVSPRPDPDYTRFLPPVPRVTGPLSPRVEYPDSMQVVAVSDSNFLFGTVGTGDARLTVNGVPVRVEPNGAFLAWLPVPEPAGAGECGPGPRVACYVLVASRGGEADTLWHPVRRPAPPPDPPAGAGAWVDTASLRSPAVRWRRPGDPVSLSVRAAGEAAWIRVGEQRFELRREGSSRRGEGSPRAGGGTAAADAGRWTARVPARELAAAACAERVSVGAGGVGRDWSCLTGPDPEPVRLRVVAAAGGDTARLQREFPLRVLEAAAPPVALLAEEPNSFHGTNGIVVGRPVPRGPYHWRFPVGTRAEVNRRDGDRFRLRLKSDLGAWVSEENVRLLPRGTPAPESAVGAVRVEPLEDRLRIRLRLSDALPLRVEEPDSRTVALTLYGARSNTSRAAHGPADPLLEAVDWKQLAGPAYRLELRLTAPVWGWRVRYEGVDTEAGGPSDSVQAGPGSGRDDATLVLEVRRPPAVDPDDPLRGRRIAVDPGHPPAGAVGPTGYYEGDANLGIARHVARTLEERGADPLLLRTDTLPLGLYRRTGEAERRGAELFVSVHNNALPDGVRPFGEEGTSTYYYHPHSRAFAAALQEGMLSAMGLRDLGVIWGNLAVVRASWMPAALTEGAFMMHPWHEAALRTEEFQRRYARGVVEGIEEFLRKRAGEGGAGR